VFLPLRREMGLHSCRQCPCTPTAQTSRSLPPLTPVLPTSANRTVLIPRKNLPLLISDRQGHQSLDTSTSAGPPEFEYHKVRACGAVVKVIGRGGFFSPRYDGGTAGSVRAAADGGVPALWALLCLLVRFSVWPIPWHVYSYSTSIASSPCACIA